MYFVGEGRDANIKTGREIGEEAFVIGALDVLMKVMWFIDLVYCQKI